MSYGSEYIKEDKAKMRLIGIPESKINKVIAARITERYDGISMKQALNIAKHDGEGKDIWRHKKPEKTWRQKNLYPIIRMPHH